jgi:hypothetical protein
VVQGGHRHVADPGLHITGTEEDFLLLVGGFWDGFRIAGGVMRANPNKNWKKSEA